MKNQNSRQCYRSQNNFTATKDVVLHFFVLGIKCSGHRSWVNYTVLFETISNLHKQTFSLPKLEGNEAVLINRKRILTSPLELISAKN